MAALKPPRKPIQKSKTPTPAELEKLAEKYPHLKDRRAIPPYHTYDRKGYSKTKPPFPVTHPHLMAWYAGQMDVAWQLSIGTRNKVQWKCSEGHQWAAEPKTLLRFHDVRCTVKTCVTHNNKNLTSRPDILLDWSSKNDGVPSSYTISSTVNVWWKCSRCGHEWKAVIRTRCRRTYCPECHPNFGRQVKIENVPHGKPTTSRGSLLEGRPDLCAEWSKRNKLPPSSYRLFSQIEVWWVCSRGHEFKAPIARRSYSNTGCPYCDDERRGRTRFIFKDVIGTIAPHIEDLSGTEIWSILSHQGMLRTPARQRFIAAMKTRQLATEDIQRFVAGEKGTASEAILKGDEEGATQAMEATISDSVEESVSDLLEDAAERQEETEPAVRALAIMRAGEALAQGATDEEALEYLIRGRLGRLWSLYFEMEQADLKGR